MGTGRPHPSFPSGWHRAGEMGSLRLATALGVLTGAAVLVTSTTYVSYSVLAQPAPPGVPTVVVAPPTSVPAAADPGRQAAVDVARLPPPSVARVDTAPTSPGVVVAALVRPAAAPFVPNSGNRSSFSVAEASSPRTKASPGTSAGRGSARYGRSSSRGSTPSDKPDADAKNTNGGKAERR